MILNVFQHILPLMFLAIGLNAQAALKDFIVIAHRSASGYLPEHTLPAVAMAHAWGVDYIEPDVVLTKDNVPIVLHDIELDTNTDVKSVFPSRHRSDGHFYAIDFTLAEIKTLHVHERSQEDHLDEAVFPKRFPIRINSSSFQVPTFEEYIQLVQGLNRSTGRKIGIYPEIKKPEFHQKEGKDITKIFYEMLQKYGYERTPEQIFIQCFEPNTLKRLKTEFKSKIPRVQLIGKNVWNESSADYDKMLTQAGIKDVSTYADGIGPSLDQIVEKEENGKPKANSIVTWAHQNDLKVHPYTLRMDSLPPEFKTGSAMMDFYIKNVKIDGIFSDFSDQVLEHLGRLKRRN